MSEELKSALARIACLEGEIAKRDEELAACRVAVENCDLFRARIAELEAGDNTELLKAYMNAEAEKGIELVKLRAELSAIKAQEPVAWISKDGTYAEASTKSTVYGSHTLPLYAEPVPVENAQVVMPERWNVPRPMWKDVRQPYGNPLNHADIEAAEKFNLALDEVARLNQPASGVYSADPLSCSGCVSGCFRCRNEPASAGDDEFCDGNCTWLDHHPSCARAAGQSVSAGGVDEREAFEAWYADAMWGNEDFKQSLMRAWQARAMLADAPAAPAADAGHVFYGMDGNHP